MTLYKTAFFIGSQRPMEATETAVLHPGVIEKDGLSQQIPLAFCIMSSKTIADYNKVMHCPGKYLMLK